MRAAQLIKYGDKDALQFTADAPQPPVEPGEVLVKVHAAGVNPFDLKLREGLMQQVVPMTFPATLGGDFAGIVSELGEGVTAFQVGQEVYGQANAVHGNGSFSDFTPVPVEAVALKPTKIDFVEAAAVPLTASSAYQGLVDTLRLAKGQRILIHGGGGGIGSFAIQLAKHLGASVATTATGDGIEYARQLGADEVIDYKTQRFETVFHDFDAVFDTVGGQTYMDSFAILKPGGQIASMLEQPHHELMQKHQVTAHYISTRVTARQLNDIATLIDQGALQVHVDKLFPLEKAAEALEAMHGPHQGRIVIKVTE